jgi:site-specific DNA-methyltransferase (adenine-specific)
MINKIYFLGVIAFLKKILEKFGENSIDLAIADPPFFNVRNIAWDKQWKNVEEYLEWFFTWIPLVERVLKGTGSLLLFHNRFETLSKIQVLMDERTTLKYKNLIIWNKRFDGAKNKGYMDGYIEVENKRKYEQMAEYVVRYNTNEELSNEFILYYTFEDLHKIQDFLNKYRKENNYTLKDVNILWGHPENSGIAGHYMTDRTQPQFIIKEKYEILKNEWNIPLEYEELAGNYIYNHQKTHHSIWNYEIAKRIIVKVSGKKNKQFHITPKPIPLIKNILLHHSKKDNMVINLFSGSGNVEYACKEMERNVLGCDNFKEFVDYGNSRLINTQTKISDFS